MEDVTTEIREDLAKLARSKKVRSSHEEEPVSKPEVEPEVVEEEDRSAFNCPDCKGEGLIVERLWPSGRICPNCKGTGKVE